MYHSQEQAYRQKRRVAGQLRVTQRDITALTWIAEQFCLSFDQLRSLLALHSPVTSKTTDPLSSSATRNVISRWLKLGYIEPPRKLIRSSSLHVWLSHKGLQELQLPYSYYQPDPTSTTHIHAVNAVRLHLQRYSLSAQWVAHRSMSKITSLRPLPDAELQMNHIPLIGIQVLECMSSPLALSQTINALVFLAQRKRRRGLIPYYSRLWYFLHNDIIPSFQQALAHLDPQLQTRVIVYNLNAQEVCAPTISSSDTFAPNDVGALPLG